MLADVRSGQIVPRIDPVLFEAAVCQAGADAKAAESSVLYQQAQLEQARTTVDNTRAAHAEAVAVRGGEDLREDARSCHR